MKNIILVACCRSGHNFVINQIHSWGDYNVINFEDVEPEDYQKRLNYIEDVFLNNDHDTIPVIVMRDLLNWWASYLTWIRKYAVDDEKIQHAFNIWTNQTQEAIGKTKYIEGKLEVSFDGFKVIPSIRQWLCESIGGNYSEDRIDVVPDAGGGSSFDNLPGSQMDTHLRYRKMIKDPYYLHMLSVNKKAMDLYRDNFSPSPEQMQLLNLL